jgi:hypothetical protein
MVLRKGTSIFNSSRKTANIIKNSPMVEVGLLLSGIFKRN